MHAVATASVLFALAASVAAQETSPPDSIGRLIDLAALPRLQPGVTCKQFASTDPAGRGDDHGHFLRLEGKTAVLAEMQGPGVIARLWSANAMGRLRVYFDGEQEPRIDAPFQDLFTGKLAPFCEPIAIRKSGGWISYFPIAYQKSCRVEVTELQNPGDLYYQLQYLTYPAGTPMRTFTKELPASEQAALAAVLAVWKSPGEWSTAAPDDSTKEYSGDVGTDTTAALDLKGPGTITSLRVSLPSPTPEALRGMVLECTFDGVATVRVPVGDFFGCGFGPTNYGGLLLGWDAHGGYCRLPMPFRERASIVLRNRSDYHQVGVKFAVRWREKAPAADAGTFHAEFRSVDRVGKELYEFASMPGPGKYVGITQALQGVGDLWYLEGNEEFTVDGEQKPSIVGTGTEDFYNGGWYWDQGTFALPLHGLGIKAEWTTNRTTPWRMQLGDAVPFQRSLVARIEHGSSNEVRDAYYSSVAYWYGTPHAVRDVTADECRLPRLWAVRPAGFVAASELRWEPSPAVRWKAWEELTTTHRGLDRPLFQAFPVSYVEQDKPAVDARLAVLAADQTPVTYKAHLKAPYADRFTLQLRGRAMHAGLKVRIDGQDLRIPSTHLLGDVNRWPPQLDLEVGALPAGEHELAFEATATLGHQPAIASLRLVPRSPYVRSWNIAPPIDAKPKGTVEDATPQEAQFLAADFDPSKAGWKQVQADGDGLDLNHHVSPRAPMLAYLLVFVQSPTARTAHALLGSDDGVRVWANGALVWSHAIHRPMGPDQDQFDVPLAAGWNRLLLKVKNDDGGYGVMLRLCDPDGTLVFATAPK
jgi:hypothetical protein